MIRRLILAILLGACSGAWALTPAQLLTLKQFIEADSTLNALPRNEDGYDAMAKALNLVGTKTVWKTQVPIVEVGRAFNGTELAGLTTGNQERLQTIALYLQSGVNPSIASNRAFFDDVFSGAGGTNTRAALLVLWKRLATRFEGIYATGTGTDAVPATLVIEGQVSRQDVAAAFGN